MVITTTSFIVLDGKTMQINQNVQLSSIYKISTSPYMDNILVIHILTVRKQIAPHFKITFNLLTKKKIKTLFLKLYRH